MALKDIKLGDTAKVGDKEFTKDENGVCETEVIAVTKTYNRDGVLAKKAELEAALAKCNEVLAEMDK